MGDPSDHTVVLGPMMSKRQLQIVEDHVEEAKKNGANVLCGGESVNDIYYPPTVLTGVTRSMKVFREETFGPLFSHSTRLMKPLNWQTIQNTVYPEVF
jgi:succinate-semialdehyde dehydrogenase/glutarate-semialdehyde dehydrogenase